MDGLCTIFSRVCQCRQMFYQFTMLPFQICITSGYQSLNYIEITHFLERFIGFGYYYIRNKTLNSNLAYFLVRSTIYMKLSNLVFDDTKVHKIMQKHSL